MKFCKNIYWDIVRITTKSLPALTTRSHISNIFIAYRWLTLYSI